MPNLALTGTEVRQGNANGATLPASTANTVLWTSDLVGCVAVCGYNGQIAFMIHSDATGNGGIGRTDLITGLRNLVAGIGTGTGFTLTLIGGSVPGVTEYLRKAGNLPDATINNGGEADGAYITWNGKVATTKAKLATELGVESVTIS